MIKITEIETGIKPPSKRGNNIKYPFQGMHVGDSFFFECRTQDITGRQTAVYATLAYWKKVKNRPTFKIRTRSVQGGIRVWRIQ